MTPSAPHAVGHNGSNEVLVDHAVRVSCRPAHTSRHVHVQEEQRESDNNYQTSQLTGRAALNFDFPAAGGSTTAYIHTILPRTEPNNEEMYQRTRFKVTADGVESAYTAWESSGISWIWH